MEPKARKSKGGKKGGTQFPRYSLKNLVPYLKPLISKTHSATINIEQLNAGVFHIGAKSLAGKVKASALKQFGLIEGDYQKYSSTELASSIAISENGDQKKHLQAAFDRVKLFVNVYNTFQNSKVEKGKIAQYAVSTLKVHPDFKDEFVKVLIESAEVSEIAKVDGANVLFERARFIENVHESDDEVDTEDEDDLDSSEEQGDSDEPIKNIKKRGSMSNISINIDVNASMDPEKLEKLLKLLKGYGAL